MVVPVLLDQEGDDIQPDAEKTNITVVATADKVLELGTEPGYKKDDKSEQGIGSGFEVDHPINVAAKIESTSKEGQFEVAKIKTCPDDQEVSQDEVKVTTAENISTVGLPNKLKIDDITSKAEDDKFLKDDSDIVDRYEESVQPAPKNLYESDSDDEPEDISLKEGKRLADENRKKEVESTKSIKEMRKQKLKEREDRNALQQKEKRERKPTSVVPEKLDDDILKFVDNEIEINPEDIIPAKTEQKNKKIIFSGDEEGDKDNDDEDFLSDEDDIKSQSGEITRKKVTAKCINDVHKDENNSAREFLKNHFFGDRVKRDHLIKHMPVKKKVKISKNQCNARWLKNRDTAK